MTEIVMLTVPRGNGRSTLAQQAKLPAARKRHGEGLGEITFYSRIVAGHHGVPMAPTIEGWRIQDDERHLSLDDPQQ
jgi:hypothetical protein